MPSLQQFVAVVRDQCSDLLQLMRWKPKVSSQRQRLQPELCGAVVAIHVDMRGFVRFVAEEVHAIGTTPQHRRHRGILAPMPHATQRERAQAVYGHGHMIGDSRRRVARALIDRCSQGRSFSGGSGPGVGGGGSGATRGRPQRSSRPQAQRGRRESGMKSGRTGIRLSCVASSVPISK